jgi:hypothetical protein
MDGKIEQHVCIKFCVKLSKSATKTPEMLREAFGENSFLTYKGNSKRYSTAIRKMTSTVLLKHGKNDGNTVYIPNSVV